MFCPFYKIYIFPFTVTRSKKIPYRCFLIIFLLLPPIEHINNAYTEEMQTLDHYVPHQVLLFWPCIMIQIYLIVYSMSLGESTLGKVIKEKWGQYFANYHFCTPLCSKRNGNLAIKNFLEPKFAKSSLINLAPNT